MILYCFLLRNKLAHTIVYLKVENHNLKRLTRVFNFLIGNFNIRQFLVSLENVVIQFNLYYKASPNISLFTPSYYSFIFDNVDVKWWQHSSYCSSKNILIFLLYFFLLTVHDWNFPVTYFWFKLLGNIRRPFLWIFVQHFYH